MNYVNEGARRRRECLTRVLYSEKEKEEGGEMERSVYLDAIYERYICCGTSSNGSTSRAFILF